jgi:hypothetical protein
MIISFCSRRQLSDDVLCILAHAADQRRADPVLVPQSNEAQLIRLSREPVSPQVADFICFTGVARRPGRFPQLANPEAA